MTGALPTVVWLSWRQLFARRRAWLAVAIVLLPFILTFFYRLASEDREGDRLAFMLGLHRELVLGVLLPLTAVIFGTTAFGGDVDDGTLIYLLVRPLPRWQVVLAKCLISFAVIATVVATSVLLAWFALRNAELPGSFARAFVAAAVTGSLLYAAMFCYLGLATRRGLIVGLLYVIFFENLLTRNLQGAKWLSVREFTISVAQWASDGVVKWTAPSVPMSTVWIVGGLILVAMLGLAVRKFGRYELAERL